jgi:carnitine-CoA ligase
VVRFDAGAVTYEELELDANRLANALVALGLEPGDRVAAQLPTGREYLTLWFAAERAGVIEVTLNVGLRGDLLLHQLRSTDCAAIVIDAEWVGRLEPLRKDLGRLPKVIVVGETDHELTGYEQFRFSELLRAGAERPNAAIGPYDDSTVIFTSGTTGPSKGVTLSPAYCFQTARTMVSVNRLAERERLFSVFPMFHTNARYASILVGMLLDEGRTTLHKRFSASRFWDICRSEEITMFNFMGALLLILSKQPERTDDRDHAVRKGWGAPAPKPICEEFEQRFGITLFECYGMTEVGIATSNTCEERLPGSCGKPVPELEVQIHDPDGVEVGPETVGEIVIRPRRPSMLFRGYYAMPEATVAASRDFWFHTGDRGRVDADGWFYFVDRVKDAIRRRGENISSWELENVFNSHDAVKESAIVGVPSELTDEEVLLVVVLKQDREVGPEALLDFSQERLPYFAVPRYVRYLDSLPKNPQQRTQKFKLREEGLADGVWDRETVGYEVRR